MKLQITESQLKYILRDENLLLYLNETIEDETKKLKEWGYEVVNTYKVNNYTMFLLHNKEEDFYEISLTSNDDDFTTYDNQIKKKSVNNGVMISSFNLMADRIKEWINRYGILVIGSLNKDRTYKYHKILSSLGFRTTPVKYNVGDEHFPDFWDFNIDR